MEKVLDLWRQGIPTRAIQTAISSEYHVTWRQVRTYIKMVETQMIEQQAEELPSKRAKIAAALESFLEDAIGAGDLRARGVALERLSKIYIPEQATQVNHDHTFGLTLDPAQIREQIRQAALERPEYVKGLLAEGEIEAIEIKPAAAVVKPNGSNGSNGHNGHNGA